MLTALKVRLYPNKEQQIALAKNFGCCRFVWNHYLNKTNTLLVNSLGYKLKRVGGILVEIDRFFPSTKLCNCCKHKEDSLTLKDREWVCPKCGTYHDRDENAAKNIREEGIRTLSINTDGQSEFQACGECVRLVSTSTKKQRSKKQESPVTALA